MLSSDDKIIISRLNKITTEVFKTLKEGETKETFCIALCFHKSLFYVSRGIMGN